ncbi:hypothetical protein [Micromonospora chersina]
MLSYIVLALALAYLALAPVAFWAGVKNRHELAIRLWYADAVVALVLIALSIANRNWLLAAVWVLNGGLALINLRSARRSRAIDEFFTA